MKKNKWIPYALASISIVLLVVFFIIPFAQLAVFSFWRRIPGTFFPEPAFTLENFRHILVTQRQYYFQIYLRTLRLAVIATAVTLFISYPLAWYISTKAGWARSFLIILVMLPMLGGAMTQTLGWIIILSPLGVINGTLLSLGIIETPIAFLGVERGIILGMIQAFMPMMILPILTAMSSLNPYLEDAAQSLGASFFTTFFRIILPLTVPGAIAGTSLVFLSNLTTFVTPLLLGQGKVQVFSTIAYIQGVEVLNYPFASAFTLLPMFLVVPVILIVKRYYRRAFHLAQNNGQVMNDE